MTNQQTGWMRNREGLGIWEHRGKVAVAGIGHSPVDRRWESGHLESSLGAYSVLAARRAMEDAGITLDMVDGVISCPGPLGDNWAPRPYFDPPYDSEDGITKVTAEWLVQQLGLPNVKYINSNAPQIGEEFGLAAQAVGDGLCSVALVLYPTGNVEGRYHQAADNYVRGPDQWNSPWGFNGGLNLWPYIFNEYCRRYNSNHDRMAPFVVNLRRNGLMVPWSYYALHQPDPLTVEDYLSARWIAKPLNLFDADRPVNASACYVVTTADKAKDMKQTPVYIWNHAEHRARVRSLVQTLDETEEWCASEARKTMEGAGLDIRDIDIFNPYDGFTLFTQHWLEAFGWHGVKKGESHDFYAGDISVHGPHPFLSSGGNNGTGRTRTAIFTDTIEQLRGTAGERQVTVKAETGIAGCVLPASNGHVVFSKYQP